MTTVIKCQSVFVMTGWHCWLWQLDINQSDITRKCLCHDNLTLNLFGMSLLWQLDINHKWLWQKMSLSWQLNMLMTNQIATIWGQS